MFAGVAGKPDLSQQTSGPRPRLVNTWPKPVEVEPLIRRLGPPRPAP